MNLFSRFLLAVARLIHRGVLASHPKFRALLYDQRNKKEFENLYEHEKMLADEVRTDTYRRAIQKYIGPEDVVLDIGTGTGILSLFAAKQKAKKIYAIDHSGFIDIARKIAKHNNLDMIEFIQTNSRDFNPKVNFDVIIHEQIGDYLFNENMIKNLMDLKKRLLKPNGKILPGKFELYLEPVSLRKEFNIPFIWQIQSYGIDFTILEKHQKELKKFKPPNYLQEWLDADVVKNLLCDPSPILFFDLNEMHSEKEVPTTFNVSKKVQRSGSIDAFCLYFNVIFDDDISFDTSPLTGYTHWGNCFFRIESRICQVGELIQYTFNMQDLLNITTWSVSKPVFKKSK